MSITPEQAQAIRRWGATTQYVSEVRLFGSQATGEAKEGSDIDIAITIGGDDPGTVRGTYFALGKRWEDELAIILGSKVHVSLYNDPIATLCGNLTKSAVCSFSHDLRPH
jgi:predicted nucleotidyltransferase